MEGIISWIILGIFHLLLYRFYFITHFFVIISIGGSVWIIDLQMIRITNKIFKENN